MTADTEAAAIRAAQAIFFISIFDKEKSLACGVQQINSTKIFCRLDSEFGGVVVEGIIYRDAWFGIFWGYSSLIGLAYFPNYF
ncbi:hypothetical protein LguiA_016521 [Lonicera macranthoides]